MTYKWTLSYIDSLTWPVIKDLLEAIKAHPPTDFVIPTVFRGAPQPIAKAGEIPSVFKAKRGKVGKVEMK